VLKQVEDLFILPYSPDTRITLLPVRLSKIQNASIKGIKVMTPVSVQARGLPI
jgi:hypothetical protein